MQIAAVGRAFPDNYYDQKTLIEAFKKHWAKRHYNVDRLESLHRNVLVGGRHLALPLEEYEELDSFTAANNAFIRCAVELGARAIVDGLEAAGLDAREIDHIFFVTTTGVATPSIDALVANRLRLRPDMKRTPIFGLGCLAGAAGVARAADYLRAHPNQVAVLVSVELCSLTLQREDLSIPNIIASGLFGDGAAAAILVGDNRANGGPTVVDSRSVFYRDTEEVMGWDITKEGFRVVLSADVPRMVQEHIREDVDKFLTDQGLSRRDISSYVCHPGGPKVLEAFQEELELPPDALALTWESLRSVGNLSSASVLMVLRDTMEQQRPREGSHGLMLAMGPGFCSELVLLRW
ncbi:MAG: 3-oxoacyl-[acyl-carrier-protein] synthase III C-terminal domain-containing protein [Vicinamibacteria bacterium]